MSPLDLAGLVFFILLALTFYFFRSITLYNGFSLIVLTAFLAATWNDVRIDFWNWIILLLGLLLDWFGLLAVRIMLTRSVSLQLLFSLSTAAQPKSIRDEMTGRLEDASKFHLVNSSEQSYQLSTFGQFISTIVVILYSVLRIQK